MQIKQKSLYSFNIKSDDVEIHLNPDYKYENGIAIFSLENEKNFTYNENIEGLFVTSAGEYESKDIFVVGKKVNGSESKIYDISTEGLHIGFVSHVKDLKDTNLDFFETCDILIIGAGGGNNFMDPKAAHDLIQKISPKCAIVFGIKEQAGKNAEEDIVDLATLSNDMPGIQNAEKTLKITKSELDSSDNTKVYYFEM